MRWIVLGSFLATIPAANWMIGHIGICVPNGPCLIPVWPGIMAPSGVLMIGLALCLRDAVHEWLGVKWVFAAILAGAAISLSVAPPAIAIASGTAFLFSELADLAVYAPLRERRLMLALAGSSIVGAVVDSAVFLFIAFGSIQFLLGQVIGKAWMVLLASMFLYLYRKRRAMMGISGQ